MWHAERLLAGPNLGPAFCDKDLINLILSCHGVLLFPVDAVAQDEPDYKTLYEELSRDYVQHETMVKQLKQQTAGLRQIITDNGLSFGPDITAKDQYGNDYQYNPLAQDPEPMRRPE